MSAAARDQRDELPVAVEAEASVLGACLLDPEAIGRAAEVVEEGMFFREPHRRLWRAMERLFRDGGVIDMTTVPEVLDRMGELEGVGGHRYLAELLDAVPTAASVEYHARIVADRAVLRRLIQAQTDGIRDCYEPGERTVGEILDTAEERILTIASKGRTPDMEPVRRTVVAAVEQIEGWQGAEHGLTGTPTGFRDLDDATGGLQKGELVVLAGRPSMGKTAMAVQMAITAAGHGYRVPIFSYEMSTEQVTQRMLCMEGRVDSRRLRRRGRLTEDDYQRLAEASAVLHGLPIWLEYDPAGTLMDVRSKARRLKAEEGELGLVVVDYLQLMVGSGQENRVQEVSELTRGLKRLARELETPVLALSQLSRAPEARSDRRPQLSDLRESGSIEQDADTVLFLYRPEYYMKATVAAEKGLEGVAELIIGKQRNGPTLTVDLYWRAVHTRFEDMIEGERPGW